MTDRARLAPDLYPVIGVGREPVAAAAYFVELLSDTIGEPATGDDIRAAMGRIRDVLGELAREAGERDLAARRKAILEAVEAPAGAEGEMGT